MAKKEKRNDLVYTQHINRKNLAAMSLGRNTFRDDAYTRIAKFGKGIRLDSDRTYVVFGENEYEVRGLGSTAALKQLAEAGMPEENDIGISF